MPTLPPEIISVLALFAPAFATRQSYQTATRLIVGTLLAVGRRTVAAALRAVGLANERHFVNYHRLLSRAKWSSLRCAQALLARLVAVFVPGDGPVVFGGDETIERRQGAKIAKKGIYRDAVRSSRSFFVKTSGLRWSSLMLLATVPWAKRVWALPVCTCLAPSERFCQEAGTRYKTLLDWMRQMLAQVRRWLPGRRIVFVGDGGYSALDFLAWCQAHTVTAVTRLRLDAALFAPVPARKPGTKGRPRKTGDRLPTLEAVANDPATKWLRLHLPRWYGTTNRAVDLCTGTALWYHRGQTPVALRWVLLRDPRGKFATQALLCTEADTAPEQILAWFMQRWQMESTFQEVRTHLGVETQRQWSARAIDRTTPTLLGLFSVVTLIAHQLHERQALHTRQAAWYKKEAPTFSDALASVRRAIWLSEGFVLSQVENDRTKILDFTQADLIQILAYAA